MRLAPLAFLFFPIAVHASIDIAFDYSFDDSGFFNDQQARDSLESAAAWLENRLNDNWAAITPEVGDSWTYRFDHPATGADVQLNGDYPEDTLVVFAGSRDLADPAVSAAASTAKATFLSGSTAFQDQVNARNSVDGFIPLGGSITFDPNVDWQFSTDPFEDAIGPEFWSTAVHELMHLLGFSVAVEAYNNHIDMGGFFGPNVVDLLGGPAPMADDSHLFAIASLTGAPAWDGTQFLDNQLPIMTPAVSGIVPSELDFAVLRDVGIGISEVPEPSFYALIFGAFSLFFICLRRR